MATMLNRPSSFHPSAPSPHPPHPHRKPLPPTARTPFPTSSDAYPPSQSHLTAPGTTSTYHHSRTRTSSSSVFPAVSPSPSQQPLQRQPQQSTMQNSYSPQYQQYLAGQQKASGTRRTLSNATSSSNSTSSNPPTRQSSTALHRTPSTASSNTLAPTSYVALMRKQKATVWCDRSQSEDPRMLAAQRLAKQRALAEVAGGPSGSGTMTTRSGSSGGVAAGVRKIRHGGAHKALLYVSPTTGGNLVGQGVPMRLSASEVDEGSDGEEGAASGAGRTSTMGGTTIGGHHQRSGSGRSSVGSGRRVGYGSGNALVNSRVYGPDSSPGVHPSSSADDFQTGRRFSTVSAEQGPQQGLTHTRTNLSQRSHSSTGSSAQERGFGGVGDIPEIREADARVGKESKDDLVRRGSVDERTTTLGARSRLFIANPDLSD